MNNKDYDPPEDGDACEICLGRNGGTPGNENVVDGVVMCDYCTADQMNTKPTPDQVNTVLLLLEEERQRQKKLGHFCEEQEAAIAAVKWAFGLSYSATTAPIWFTAKVAEGIRKEGKDRKRRSTPTRRK